MIIHDVIQRSPEWYALRAGKLTGSCAKDMLATVKSGEAAKRRDLRFKLVAERLSGQSQEDGFVNAAMQWGIDKEADAIKAYEARTGQLVRTVGFCQHEALMAGTSPDGLVGDDGIVSIKCPKTATHLSYLRAGVEPDEHRAQNTHELWVTGRRWVDFVSYDPRLPEHLRLLVLRVRRAGVELDDYEARAVAFLAEVDTELQAIRTMTVLPAVLKEAVYAL